MSNYSIDDLHRGFAEETPRLGLWLDTSDQTVDQTVEAILRGRDDALVDESRPTAGGVT